MAALKNIPVRILVIALITLVGCTDSDKNSSLIFEELNESLERSNEMIYMEAKTSMLAIQRLTEYPPTFQIGKRRQRKAEKVDSCYSQVISFIDSLIFLLDIRNENQNKKLVEKIFLNEHSGETLYSMLTKPAEEIFSWDREIKKEFENRLPITKEKFKKQFLSTKEFNDIFFTTKTKVEALATLLKFKNDLLLSKFNIVTYLRYSFSNDTVIFDKIQGIGYSNSKVFKIGQEMVINAGIGEFTSRYKPSFLINGVNILPNENGVGEYKMKITKRPGNYKVHIVINFIKETGERGLMDRDIEYTVVE